MEQSKFINILRKVIKEEIRSVIKQELTEILQEGLKSTINDMSTKKSITSITVHNFTNSFFLFPPRSDQFIYLLYILTI